MPLVIELIVLMLAAYTAGLGIGWVIWGTNVLPDDSHTDDHD